MMRWILRGCACALLMAPSVALANCPPKQRCGATTAAPPRAAPAYRAPPRTGAGGFTGQTHTFGSQTTGQHPVFGSGSATGGQTHRFGTGGYGAATGNQSAGYGSNGNRRFGTGGGATGSQSSAYRSGSYKPTFGSSGNGHGGQSSPVGTHSSSGIAAGPTGERHFGQHASQTAGDFGHRESAWGGAVRHSGHGSYYYGGRERQRFAAERFRYPHGYAYRRWGRGGRLPHVFLVRRYYVENYADYGFDEPPPNFVWVRYGPDLLLVNAETGDIGNVVYGVFDDAGDQGPPPDGGYGDAPPDDDGQGPN